MRETVRSAEIAGQTAYHAGNARMIAKLDKRIHHTGQALFGATAVMCIVYITVWGIDYFTGTKYLHRDLILGLFTFLTALLPTLGSALGAIYAQGDFKTVAEQSKRTAARLAVLDKILAEEPLEFARLADRVQKTSDIMMVDLEEWQTVFRARPLSLPA